MNRFPRIFAPVAIVAALWAPSAGAQEDASGPVATPSAAEPVQTPTGETAADPAAAGPEVQPWGAAVFRLGQDHTLAEGGRVRELIMILGSAVVRGTVTRDAVVVFGTARLSSTAIVEDSLVVIGGSAIVEPGARVGRDIIIVGGSLDAPEGFAPEAEQVVIGSSVLEGRFRAMAPWLTRGLLYGRIVVPDVLWLWAVIAVVFVVYAAVNALFDAPVARVAETLADRPLTTFAAGLLVLLLTGPVCVLLAVSVVGIAAIPILLCALVGTGVMGRVAVARWVGAKIVPRADPDDGGRARSALLFATGFAVLCAAYIVPILGLVVWMLVGVVGLGAATLTALSAYRREHPREASSVQQEYPLRRRSGVPYVAATMHERPLAATAEAEPDSDIASADLVSFPRAAFHERLAAFVLDIILVVIAYNLVDFLQGGSGFFLLLLAYHVGFWTWKGTTVGGIICQLRLVRVDGTPLRLVDALVRGLSSIFSLAVLGIGGLWILRDPERQAWHDRIAGTYVVKVPRSWPL